MRRAITLTVTALTLAACTRGGSSASESASSGAGVAVRDSAAGVVPNTAGGEVMLDPAGGAAVPSAALSAPGLGGSTVVTPGNNIPSPPFGAAGTRPAPAMTGVPASPIVGMGGTPGQVAPPPTTPVPAAPTPPTPASPATPSTPPGLVAPGTRPATGTPAAPTTGSVRPL